MLALYVWFKSLFASEEGQDLVEYALIAGLIALVAVAAILAAGGQVNVIWDNIQAALKKAGTGL